MRFDNPFRFVRSQIFEISNDRALQLYGAALAMVHVFSALWWVQFESLQYLSQGTGSICWPWFESCYLFRFTSPHVAGLVFSIYVLLALINITLFLKSKIHSAYTMAICLFVFKLLLFAMDFRMRGNHHYMAFIVASFYLFIPQKKQTIPLVVVGFYVAASLLKFNNEWLSGAALSTDGKLPFRGKWVEWACAYVIILETLLIWGLLLPRTNKFFWFTFSQVVIFHLFSLPIVNWFYPVIMACLLSIFFLRHEQSSPPKSFLALAALSLFWFTQLAPYGIKGDTALSGDGRFLAFNMMDARSMCRISMIGKRNMDRVEISRPPVRLPVRMWCHSLVFYNWAREICRSNQWDNIDFIVSSKRSTDFDWKQTMRAVDFCTDSRRYTLLSPQPWGIK